MLFYLDLYNFRDSLFGILNASRSQNLFPIMEINIFIKKTYLCRFYEYLHLHVINKI